MDVKNIRHRLGTGTYGNSKVASCWNCWSSFHLTDKCPHPTLTTIQRERLRISLEISRYRKKAEWIVEVDAHRCLNCWSLTDSHVTKTCPEPLRTVIEREALRVQKRVRAPASWLNKLTNDGVDPLAIPRELVVEEVEGGSESEGGTDVMYDSDDGIYGFRVVEDGEVDEGSEEGMVDGDEDDEAEDLRSGKNSSQQEVNAENGIPTGQLVDITETEPDLSFVTSTYSTDLREINDELSLAQPVYTITSDDDDEPDVSFVLGAESPITFKNHDNFHPSNSVLKHDFLHHNDNSSGNGDGLPRVTAQVPGNLGERVDLLTAQVAFILKEYNQLYSRYHTEIPAMQQEIDALRRRLAFVEDVYGIRSSVEH